MFDENGLSLICKRGKITAEGNLDAQGVIDSFTCEVFRETFSQLPRIVADDVVIDGAVADGPAEHMHTNLLLGDLVLPALERFRDNVEKKG